MADIFREVEEDLRRDQAAKLWKRYGRYAIAAALVVVLAAAGYEVWRAYDRDWREQLANDFATAKALADNAERSAAIEAFAAVGAPGQSGYGTLAAFERAQLLADGGDVEDARALWNEIAADGRAPFAPVATLLAISSEVDGGDAAVLNGRLDTLKSNFPAYRPLALELQALLALRQGNGETARLHLTAVADDLSAPPGLRARASELLQALDDQ